MSSAQAQSLEIIFNGTNDVTCPGGSDGSVSARIFGGAPPFNYQWSNGNNGTVAGNIAGFTRMGSFKSHVYYRANNPAPSYTQASLAASSREGYLLSVNSPAELNWLTSNNSWQEGDYIGGSDKDIEGNWKWDSSEPWTVNNWIPGAPFNGNDNNDFIQLLSNGQWVNNEWTQTSGERYLMEVPFSIDMENLPAGVYLLTVTDSQGNSESFEFTVEEPFIEVDVVSTPSSNCGTNQDGSLDLNIAGSNEPYIVEWADGASGHSRINLTSGEYQAVVTDGAGCQSEYTVNIPSIDNQAPQAQVSNTVIYLDDNGSASLTPMLVDNGTSDNCTDDLQLLVSDRMVVPISGAGDDGQENSAGQMDMTSATLDFFYDTESETHGQIIGLRFQNINLPAGTTIQNAYLQFTSIANNPSLNAPFGMIHIEDAEDASPYTNEAYAISNRTYLEESIIWTMQPWTSATEQAPIQRTPDVSSLVQNIINQDGWEAGNSIAFMLNSPNPLNTNTGNQAATFEQNPELAPRLVIEYGVPQVDFDCNDVGSQPKSFSAIDDAGNVSTVNFMLTVVDEIAPTALASGQTVYLDENGEGSITLDMVDNGSFDNCGIANRTLSKTAFTCQDIGEQIVSLVVTDVHGNTDQAVIVVNVVDGIAPDAEVTNTTAYVDENGWVQLNVDEMLTVTNENCGVADLVINEELFSCQDVGVTSLNIEVSDFAGNTSTFNPQLIIADTIKPTFMTSAIDLFLDDEGNAELSQDLLTQYAHDNCGLASIEADNTYFSCDSNGEALTTNVVITDIHGNITQREIGVFIIDAEAPDVSVADITLVLDENGEAILDLEMLDMVISDNCSIASTELNQNMFNCNEGSWNFASVTCTDYAGNSKTETFTVYLVDTIAPVISGPDNFKFCEGTPVVFENVSAYDACLQGFAIGSGPTEGSTPEPGDYIVSFIAYDAEGNLTSKDVNVTIVPQPVFDLGSTQYADYGSIVSLEITPFGDGYSYQWNNGSNGPFTDIMIEQSITTATLTVTSPEGCTFTDTVQILIDPTMSVEDAEAVNAVTLYPNPTVGSLAVEFNLTDAKENIQITVSDLTGKTVLLETIPLARNGEQVFLDLRNLANGYYVVNILADQLNVSERVIKQ